MQKILRVASYALIVAYPLSYYAAVLLGAGSVRWLQCGYVTACAGWLALLWSLRRGGAAVSARRRELLIAIVLALGVRVALLPLPPSDDLHRYVWEGRVRLAGHDPYLHAPDDPLLAPLRDEGWQHINHPEHAAIYAPLTQAVCAAVAAVWPRTFAFKLLALAADVLTIALVVRWLRRRGDDPRWVMVYALCPAVLSAFAREGHIDVLMVAALAAFLLLTSPRSRLGDRVSSGASLRAALLSGAVLGAAVAAKWVPLLLLPWWLVKLATGSTRPMQRVLTRVIGLGAAAVAFALPAAFYLDAGAAIVAPLTAFTRDFHNLDAARMFLSLFADAQGVEWIARVLIVGTALVLAAVRVRPAVALVWTLGVAILVSPTVHPWYLAWLLPALCGYRAWPWFVLVVTMVFAYEGDHLRETAGVWQMPEWVVWWVFVPFYAALTWYAASRARAKVTGSRR